MPSEVSFFLHFFFLQIVDTIRHLGVEAFVNPESDVSFSPSLHLHECDKNGNESDENGTVLLYQRSDNGDVITSLSKSLPPIKKELKKSLSKLWKSCLIFKMFSISREDSILLQCQQLFDIAQSVQSQYIGDVETERIQRMIVMETALAAGLGSLLSEYVLAQADSSSRFSRGVVF